jgi:hypothetical protein
MKERKKERERKRKKEKERQKERKKESVVLLEQVLPMMQLTKKIQFEIKGPII